MRAQRTARPHRKTKRSDALNPRPLNPQPQANRKLPMSRSKLGHRVPRRLRRPRLRLPLATGPQPFVDRRRANRMGVRLRRSRAAPSVPERRSVTAGPIPISEWEAALGGFGEPHSATAGTVTVFSVEPTPLHTERVAQTATPAWRTLNDIDDAPPSELLFGMAEPDGPTLFNAAGGTGKGTTGAYFIREAQGLGIRPMIYDAENRPREWARRTSGLGVDRQNVVYVQPGDLPRRLLGQPLWDVAPHLAAVAKASGAGLLIVDSIMPAVGVGEERLKSDGQAPYLYVGALDALGIPSISFSHPPKGQRDGDPFGSVAWVNAMRLTWQGTPGGGDGHRVRWRARKRNERGAIPGVLLTFTYDEADRLCGAVREDDDVATRDWLLGALVRGPLSIPQLVELLLEESDEMPSPEEVKRTEDRFGHALRRMAREGWVGKAGKASRADLWQLLMPRKAA